MSSIIIRSAKPTDVEQLVELLKALFAIEADFVFDPAKQAQGLRQLLDSDKDCVLVAESLDDHKVVGLCTVQTLISTAEGGAVGLVEDLIVAADFRNQGIAKKLLAEVACWAESRALKRLQLLADKNNGAALAFYRKQGWDSTQLICLRKPVGR